MSPLKVLPVCHCTAQ